MPTVSDKIVLITRKTRLEELVERHNTIDQARFVIERGGGDFAFFQKEHDTYQHALEQLNTNLSTLARVHTIERSYLPNYIFTERDAVITLGIDGLVVNTAKYLTGQPVIAVNPDPQNIDGILLPFNITTATPAVRQVLQGQVNCRSITMGEVTLNDGQRLLAFNDFFIGVKSHVSARYKIVFNTHEERHSSCGILVSTGAGSTGWLSSLFNMARGMTRICSPTQTEITPPELSWESNEMFFVVREPFISKTSAAEIVCGRISTQQPLIVISEMRDNGVIFSDGVENDFLSFQAGTTATIAPAAVHTRLVMP